MSEVEQTFVECEKSIRLPIDDWKSLMRKCGEYGISIEELFQSFIEDLVDGIYSNRSDVRMYAEQWLRSAYQPDNSLLSWLFYDYIGDVDGFVDLLENIDTGKRELIYYAEHPEEYNEEEIEFLQTDMLDWEDTLRECKADYLKYNPSADWDIEVKKVKDWYRNYDIAIQKKGEL